MGYHLTLNHLAKNFGSVPAVRDVSLRIGRGELVTLLGPSGCGKTTTLQMLAGFLQPDSGTIHIGDRDITRVPPYRRNTPMVFQEYALFPHLNVFENIAYGLKQLQRKDRSIPRPQTSAPGYHEAGLFSRLLNRGADRNTIRNKVAKVLDILGLPPQIGDRFPNQLSGGQQQRIALARALVLDPEVLLLDEPLSNLDAKLRVSVRYEIQELRKRFNMTIIFVTHDQEEAMAISDQIVVMNKGVVEQCGEPAEIYYRPQNEFVAGFIGETNFLDVNIASCIHNEQQCEVAFEWRNQVFQARGQKNGVQNGERRKLLLRPEALSLYRRDQISGRDNLIPGRIKHQSFLGATTRYWVDIGGAEMIVDDAEMPRHGLLEGEIFLGFRERQLHFI